MEKSIPGVYKIKKIIFLFCVLFGCGMFLPSCNYFTEPEPFVNKQANPLEIESNPFLNYTDGQSVSGTITLSYISDSPILFPIDHVDLFIDSVFIGSQERESYLSRTRALYSFNVDTKNWPDGRHTIRIVVCSQQDSLGLHRVYSTTLIFDQSLTIPTHVSITTENSHSRISWTPTKLTNFSACLIRRGRLVRGHLHMLSNRCLGLRTAVISSPALQPING
jgi:hypothetical protein